MLPSPLSTASSAASEAHAERALRHFQELTGTVATHLVYAPGRVNLIGEHTDYNGGFVLPMAIELGVYVAARRRDDRYLRIWSTQLPGPPIEINLDQVIERAPPAWSNYVRGVVAGLSATGAQLPGFDAVIYASLPAGSGLSSSAALEVAVATLGELLAGVTLDPVKKALLCQTAEHRFAGTPCGIMDQFAVIFGQRGHVLLIDCQSLTHQLVPMRGNNASILIVNTMVKHELSDGGYESRRADCHEAARLLGVKELRDVTAARVDEARGLLPERLFRRARHVTTENARTLAAVNALRDGAWEELGELMYASHASLRDDFDVSCAELDLVVEIARELGKKRGVHGCRMTGAGFGGCCVALIDAEQAAALAAAIRDRYRHTTGIDPALLSTQAADGPTVLLKPSAHS